jgi:hypothetical protein
MISQERVLYHLQQWHIPSFIINFVAGQMPEAPLHVLPYEYPWLALLPFSLGLAAPKSLYQVAFAFWMILGAAGLYLLLLRWRSRSTALIYALYMVLGTWGTLAGRFDIVPAALTLLAVICAERKQWQRAFALLALATLCKFYPAVLLLPFLLSQQIESAERWYAWRRWRPLGVFVLVCVIVVVISLLLSVTGTLAPLSYFGARPVQIESLSASLLWLFSLPGWQSIRFAFTFGSVNMYSSWATAFSALMTLVLLVGLGCTFWQQWRGRIELPLASLLTLLIVMMTSKVFSPQYLIWIIPLIAYIGQRKQVWVISWCAICLLTTMIYPYIYQMAGSSLHTPETPLFFPVVTLRNFLLAGFVIYLLISSMHGVKRSIAPSGMTDLALQAGQEKSTLEPGEGEDEAVPVMPE